MWKGSSGVGLSKGNGCFESYVMMVDGEMIPRTVVPQSYVDVIVATWQGHFRFLEEDLRFDRAQAAELGALERRRGSKAW